MAVNEVRHNNRIVPSWFPFIQLAIEELEGTMPNVEPALTTGQLVRWFSLPDHSVLASYLSDLRKMVLLSG